MNKSTALKIKNIVSTFTNLNGTSFVGVKGYLSKTTGELSNHVINVNFSYGNAVARDLKALQSTKESDILAVIEKGFSKELVLKAIAKLSTSFINNQNKATQSNQSKAQENIYVKINNAMKLNIETGLIHLYAMGISKKVITKGTYKTVNSRELTLCQNAIKKYFNFSTSKYRNFIIDNNQLVSINISGEQLTVD